MPPPAMPNIRYQYATKISEIASTINEALFSKLKAPASRLGAAYAPIAYSRTIETAQIPHAGTIAARVRELLK